MMAAIRSSLVVGAGPAGLTSAIALRGAGVESVEVIEQGGTQDVLGSELFVSPGMLAALDTIGLADAAVSAGVGIDTTTICASDGTVLMEIPCPRLSRPDLPGGVGISRPALYSLLRDEALRRGVTIHEGERLEGLTQDAAGVDVQTTAGDRGRYDLVVAADGVNSVVRNALFPHAPQPEYVGQIAWRARVPRRTGPLLAAFEGHGRRAGIITVSDEHSYLFLLVNDESPERPARADFPALLREALAEFGGEIAAVRDDIQDPERVHYTLLTPLIAPAPWHSGRVLLVGDAVHATTPHLAYGAGLAIEDGVVLGQAISANEDLGSALADFTAQRWERARMVVETGADIVRMQLLPDPPLHEIGQMTSQAQMEIAAGRVVT